MPVEGNQPGGGEGDGGLEEHAASPAISPDNRLGS